MRVRLDVAEPLLSHEVETERRLDGMIETAQRGIESMLQRGYRQIHSRIISAQTFHSYTAFASYLQRTAREQTGGGG